MKPRHGGNTLRRGAPKECCFPTFIAGGRKKEILQKHLWRTVIQWPLDPWHPTTDTRPQFSFEKSKNVFSKRSFFLFGDTCCDCILFLKSKKVSFWEKKAAYCQGHLFSFFISGHFFRFIKRGMTKEIFTVYPHSQSYGNTLVRVQSFHNIWKRTGVKQNLFLKTNPFFYPAWQNLHSKGGGHKRGGILIGIDRYGFGQIIYL